MKLIDKEIMRDVFFPTNGKYLSFRIRTQDLFTLATNAPSTKLFRRNLAGTFKLWSISNWRWKLKTQDIIQLEFQSGYYLHT